MVPLSELLDTRKRAQAAEEAQRQTALQAQQLTEMLARYTQPQQQPQRQPEPIDPDVDPGAYIRDLEARMAHNMHVQQLNFSEQRAREKFGDEIVNKATEAAVQSGYNQLFLNKPDAYKELVTWYQGQQVSQEIGDPTQYRQRLETELRAKIIAEMRQGTPPPANLPPSFAGSTKAAYAAPVVEDAGDFFKTMMNRR
jgi:hypothetical protein